MMFDHLRCAECGEAMVYILETFPDGIETLRAWCVNGEKGCKSAGKKIVIDEQ